MQNTPLNAADFELIEDTLQLAWLDTERAPLPNEAIEVMPDGVEAIVNYNAKSRDIALVITDVDMPNLGGAILAATLRRLNPQLRIIAMSGLSSAGVARDDVEEIKRIAAAFLPKPFSATDLLAVVHRVLHPEPKG